MDILEQFLRNISYKFPKGYPDINDAQDMLMLEGLLENLGINLGEVKKPYAKFLSAEAKKVADKLKQQLNLPDEEIKAHSKNRIIIFTDRSRADVFGALEKLGYEREPTITGSSGGGYKDESGIEIIHKNITGVGSAGLDNEGYFCR